jgi:heme/copper-type cytochrome/quinol oxidase subunit 2
VLTAAVLAVATGGGGVAWAQDGTSDSGGATAGESASAWDVGSFLFWMLIVIGVVAILALVLVLATRGDGASDDPRAPED